MKTSTMSTTKMTTILTPEDMQALNQSAGILQVILDTITDKGCDTIALSYGEELHEGDLEDTIEILNSVLHNLPEDTEIW